MMQAGFGDVQVVIIMHMNSFLWKTFRLKKQTVVPHRKVGFNDHQYVLHDSLRDFYCNFYSLTLLRKIKGKASF